MLKIHIERCKGCGVKVERLCGWHGFEYSKGYLTLGYWLVSFK